MFPYRRATDFVRETHSGAPDPDRNADCDRPSPHTLLYVNDRAWCWNCSVPGCGHIPCIPSAGSIVVLSSLDAASGGEPGDCGAMREVVRASSAEHRSCSTTRSAAARPTGGQARLPKIQTRKVGAQLGPSAGGGHAQCGRCDWHRDNSSDLNSIDQRDI